MEKKFVMVLLVMLCLVSYHAAGGAVEFVVESIEGAIAEKEEAIVTVTSSLDKERAAYYALEPEGDLTEQDIAKAKKKLEVSIAEQERVVGDLEDSIARLKDTIGLLGFEPFMAAHWTLDDGSGTVALDSSGHGHDGTLADTMDLDTCWDLTDNALEFDGIDDYVQVTGYKGITGGNARTCAAWVKATGTGDFLTWGSDSEVNGNMWMFRINAGGFPAVGVRGGSMISSVLVQGDQWHHVVAVLPEKDSPKLSDIVLYVDGILDENVEHHYEEDRDIITGDVLDVLLGARLNDIGVYGPNYYYGTLDDVRIYDKALNSAEIAELFGL